MIKPLRSLLRRLHQSIGSLRKEVYMCTKSTLVLVGGFGTRKCEVKGAAWQLCREIYNVPHDSRLENHNKVKWIVDTSPSLRKVNQEDVEKLLNLILPKNECECGRISCAIFAHSHGAKILEEAFEERSVVNFLQKHPRESKTSWESIKKWKDRNVAVLTLGSILNLEKHFAKVCVNLQLDTDWKSYFGRRLFDQRQADKYSTFLSEYDGEPATASGLGRIFKLFRGHKHTMNDYFQAESVKSHIFKCLSLREEKQCAMMS